MGTPLGAVVTANKLRIALDNWARWVRGKSAAQRSSPEVLLIECYEAHERERTWGPIYPKVVDFIRNECERHKVDADFESIRKLADIVVEEFKTGGAK